MFSSYRLLKHISDGSEYEVSYLSANPPTGAFNDAQELEFEIEMLAYKGALKFTDGTNQKIVITETGNEFVENYETEKAIEKEKEDIDFKLKKISVYSIEKQKHFPFLGLIVAAIAIIAPIAYDSVKNKANSELILQDTALIERILKRIKQHDIQNQDSIIILLNDLKRNGYRPSK